jgi:hypothetical protein
MSSYKVTEENAIALVQDFKRTGDLASLINSISNCCWEYGKYSSNPRRCFTDKLIEELLKLDCKTSCTERKCNNCALRFKCYTGEIGVIVFKK